MSSYEVPEPILNSPFEEPQEHWQISEGELPRKLPGRRSAMYFYKPPSTWSETEVSEEVGIAIELKLVNRIRQRLKEWREQGWPSATRTTLELLQYWHRDGREQRLFFAQLEAVETIIFLTEARADFLQGISIPIDEPSDDRKAEGYSAFRRLACKMATGSGKTTVMAMIAAWAILNKLNDRSDARFSDVVLVVCPNVTIRNRLQELNPELGEASIYRTRDLVPAHLHHAYRIRRPEPDASEDEIFGEEEEGEEFFKEATVWIEGLDRIHRRRGINFCVDLSATPYFLARVGQETNRPFPWVTSDFGLIDAIESGLVKIPQLAVRDSSGAQIPGYFNIWRWIIPKLNYVVADTEKWEQSAAYFLDTHPYVHSFVKNSGLGLAIPYLHNGQPHDYLPDFIAHLRNGSESFMILETKGYDPLKEIKEQAALRWVSAVNSEGTFGHWAYTMVSRPEDVPAVIEKSATAR